MKKLAVGKRLLNYFPIFSLFCFWASGALLGAIQIGEASYIILGLVTLPAVLLMLAAVRKVREREQKDSHEQS